MKILILQLARLGDLYQSWPVARALRRAHPEADIRLLARARFADAARSLEEIDGVVALPSREILAPLLEDQPDFESSSSAMQSFVAELAECRFDRVINLSFSPLSSYLAFMMGGDRAGYSRHADGHLAIPDDASAYFYAQAGPGRQNRIHLTEIFAQAAGVELAGEDWRPASGWREAIAVRASRARGRARASKILLHVGASDARKTLSPAKWAGVAREILRRTGPDIELAMIGSGGEAAIADSVAAACADPRFRSLVGRTDSAALEKEIASADLLIGGDSGPMQIASLSKTPALCLSFPSVSHWETGPRSVASRIFEIADERDVASDSMADEALRLLEGVPSLRPCWVSQGPTGPFLPSHEGMVARYEPAFGWNLLKAIYMGDPFPPSPDATFALACRRLLEANDLAVEQLRRLRAVPGDSSAALILARADELLAAIARLEPRTGALARWLETERLRVGPQPFESVASSYLALHEKFSEILRVYDPPGTDVFGPGPANRRPSEGASNGS